MPATPQRFSVSGDVAELARTLVDWESPSGSEKTLADAIEATLLEGQHLEVLRVGNTVAARTNLRRTKRVVWAGHIDTVPPNNNLPSRLEDGWLWGRGSVDMKSGVAIGLALARTLETPQHDVTWIFYDNEEVEATKNGLGVFGVAHPDWVEGDFAIVGEPSNGGIEGGCNGTLRCVVTTTGVRAHSARSWKGENAIHAAHDVMNRLVAYQPSTITVDGLDYREGLNAVGITGGVAGNVIPDLCEVTVNYRFAPDKTVEEAISHVEEVFHGHTVAVVDSAAGARPGLDQELVQAFIESVGVLVSPKYGWTDVARFGQWGIPAVNFGPGDPSLAHADDERVQVVEIETVFQALAGWLTSKG